MARKNPARRKLTPEKLIQVSDGIVVPTMEQILIYRDFRAAKLGVMLSGEEVIARLRHLPSPRCCVDMSARDRKEEVEW